MCGESCLVWSDTTFRCWRGVNLGLQGPGAPGPGPFPGELALCLVTCQLSTQNDQLLLWVKDLNYWGQDPFLVLDSSQEGKKGWPWCPSAGQVHGQLMVQHCRFFSPSGSWASASSCSLELRFPSGAATALSTSSLAPPFSSFPWEQPCWA